jgi:hypothetical protein
MTLIQPPNALRRLRLWRPRPDGGFVYICTIRGSNGQERQGWMAMMMNHDAGGLHRSVEMRRRCCGVDGCSGCFRLERSGRVGLAPTGKRRLVTAHTSSGHWGSRPCACRLGGKQPSDRMASEAEDGYYSQQITRRSRPPERKSADLYRVTRELARSSTDRATTYRTSRWEDHVMLRSCLGAFALTCAATSALVRPAVLIQRKPRCGQYQASRRAGSGAG